MAKKPSNELTVGRLLLDRATPEDMRDETRVFNKKESGKFFNELARKHPDKYVEVLHQFNQVAREAGTYYGGSSSVSLRDLHLPPRVQEYRKRIREQIMRTASDRTLSSAARNRRIVDTISKADKNLGEMLQKEFVNRENAFATGVHQGFRGSPVQLRQLVFGDMLMPDSSGAPLPVPGLRGYGEGVSPSEFWSGAYGSRTGMVAVQLATARAGFLGKQLAQSAQGVVVTGKDCGAKDVGLPVDGSDPDILGSVLARPVAGLAAGTVIQEEHLSKLRDANPVMRSLLTCQQPEGVCQRCSGLREDGEYPKVGVRIGLRSATGIAEPTTQLALSTKHSGGTVGEQGGDLPTGLDLFEQFVQMPESFRGASVLSPVDGEVRGITPAPQGGQYIQVDNQQLYVAPARMITVKKGETVDMGDALTDGIPNPAEVVQFKGLGDGRRYFQERFTQLLRDSRLDIHKRNVEALARPFFDRVKVTDPEGIQGYTIGDIVPYTEIQARYEPRKNSISRSVKASKGMYLEQPVLHYTIGTRVRPKMVEELGRFGVKDLLVNEAPPPFEPEAIRLMGVSEKDPDWKSRMSGFNLKRSFIAAAQRGMTSKTDTTSPTQALMDPSKL